MGTASINSYMGMWSTRHGKFIKKDPNHGCLWRWIKDNWRAFWNSSWIDHDKKQK